MGFFQENINLIITVLGCFIVFLYLANYYVQYLIESEVKPLRKRIFKLSKPDGSNKQAQQVQQAQQAPQVSQPIQQTHQLELDQDAGSPDAMLYDPSDADSYFDPTNL